MTVRYCDDMTNLFKRPEEVERDLEQFNKKIPTEVAVGISIVTAAVLGRNASFWDKAAYVAYPFAVEAAAKYGAQRGNGDPRK